MRPRVFPAEDPLRIGVRFPPDQRFNEAAGIPPRKTTLPGLAGRCRRSFNEAAGIPRGRRLCLVWPVGVDEASMRPRVFPAEDTTSTSTRRPGAASFNEAAGIPRGRHEGRIRVMLASTQLQ